MSSLETCDASSTGCATRSGGVYLVTTVLDGRSSTFTDLYVARLLIRELRLAHELGWVTSYAWVVMPDHLHWLIRVRELSLAKVVRLVKARSTRRINQHLGRTGTLWQDGYQDRPLGANDSIQAAAGNLVANPIRAGLVQQLQDYPHWDAIWL